MGMPERVVNACLRSLDSGGGDFLFGMLTLTLKMRNSLRTADFKFRRMAGLKPGVYSLRARRNDVIAKKTKSNATTIAR